MLRVFDRQVERSQIGQGNADNFKDVTDVNDNNSNNNNYYVDNDDNSNNNNYDDDDDNDDVDSSRGGTAEVQESACL